MCVCVCVLIGVHIAVCTLVHTLCCYILCFGSRLFLYGIRNDALQLALNEVPMRMIDIRSADESGLKRISAK